MRVGILRFPGANCDADALWAFGRALGHEAEYIWHKDQTLAHPFDLIVVPGGFTYGDYLRPGAIARFSPIMAAVERYAKDGGRLLGICNGFQILTEAGLLPGALARNRQLKFISREVCVRVEAVASPWTAGLTAGQVLRLPVAHHDGAYTAGAEDLQELKRNGQILLSYCSPAGETDPAWNFNGSELAIAGIRNREGNVFGLMPHPERAMATPFHLTPHPEKANAMPLGSADGFLFLEGLCAQMEAA